MKSLGRKTEALRGFSSSAESLMWMIVQSTDVDDDMSSAPGARELAHQGCCLEFNDKQAVSGKQQ